MKIDAISVFYNRNISIRQILIFQIDIDIETNTCYDTHISKGAAYYGRNKSKEKKNIS